MSNSTTPFTCNQRHYRLPDKPVAVLCLDGSADEYLDAALAREQMPNLQKMAVRGYRGMARGALPSFTNVNNSSIITGVPPSVHGIGGNFFFDPVTGREMMMNSAGYLRAESILAAAARAGRKVGVVTAKEKLRGILSHELQGIAFSSENASQAQLDTHGIAGVETLTGKRTPEIYSPEASLYVLWSGVALLEKGLADFLYLSTTDYMQHTYAPEAPEAIEFYAGIDEQLGRLLELGAIIGVTADHGMNAKQKPNGHPNVIYLESMLEQKFGPGFRVILPITDPYVVHHGALGSFAVIHLPAGQRLEPVQQWLMDFSGITEVHDHATAARKLELPEDRLGELVVLSGRDVVMGRTPEYHDLNALHGALRSHGGRYEEMVPLVISHPLTPEYRSKTAGDIRNFDIFDVVLNGVESA
jgi:phosphonoacetate hydrolase